MVQSKSVRQNANALHELGYKIFLDRYALKDMTRATLQEGDTVIVVVDSKTGQREVGKVTSLTLPKVTVQLLDGTEVTRDVEHVDKPLETAPEQMMDRVARGIAEAETAPEKQAEWEKKFRWLLDGWKFIPGGRILTGAGTDQELTYYNCMPPEQEILTADGYKPIADVRVGELVVTHRNRLRPVLHKFERETEELIYIINPKKLGFDSLRVTGEHKILVIRSDWINNKHRSRDGLRLAQEPSWIPASELHVGDFLAVAVDNEEYPTETIVVSDYISGYAIENGQLSRATQRGAYGRVTSWGTHFEIPNELVVDEELAYFFGRWLGDGCVTHRSRTDIPSGIKIVFGLDEEAEAHEIAAIIHRRFGVAASVKLSSTKRWYDVWANSLALGEFFKAFFGAYSYGKRIHNSLMHLPNNLTLEILRGIFSADGYTSDNKLGIALSNRTLAVQVHHLLMRLGYFFSIRENTHKLGKNPAYRIQATAEECAPLFEHFFGKKAPEVGLHQKYYLEYGNLRWVRIDSIETETYRGIVMDMEVEEDHSFVSAGVVVSNCYVIPSPRDSRGGIIETLRQMTEIMSRGGGVGINISSLRPRHAYVKGVNGRSSGSVSWGALYSFVTGLIEQGGCFGPDERIATNLGLIPARELADRIEAGEVIHAHTHKGLRRITAKFRNGIKPLFEVKTSRGYSVKITEDHKVAVLMDGKITTMPLKYLQIGDEILLLLDESESNNPIHVDDPISESHTQIIEAIAPAKVLEQDTITSITPLGDSDVYDFEVDDVHLLSGNGVYTSNSRRGALMLILNDWHPDVFDFINSKRQMGQITNANISVGVSDKLMEAVKNDGDWTLMFPDTSDPNYDEDWDGDLDKWIAQGRNVIPYRTVKAAEVWNAMIESAWASAEPGVWFRERSNKMANSWYFNPLISTNPCVTGDTRIYTDHGMVKAEDLFNDETDIDVVLDGRFGVDDTLTPATRVFYTGHKPVYRLQTEEGYFVRATADHRIMTARGWVEMQDLKPGDKVHILNRKGGFGREGSERLGRILGWLVGDGTIKEDRAVLMFFGDEKRELAPMFAEYVQDIVEPMTVAHRSYSVSVINIAERDEARVQSFRLRTLADQYGLVQNKFQVPDVVFRGTEEMQRGFLQALFTADGSVQQTTSKAVVIRLASSHLPLLEQTQMLLGNFGIASRIFKNRRLQHEKMMPDGKGGQKLYQVKAQHELHIAKENILTFMEEIGFLMEYKTRSFYERLKGYKVGPRPEKFTVIVQSVQYDGEEDVYDLTEPRTHSMVANSLVIHQCGEQPLGSYSVCNLGALNLGKFYDETAQDVAWDDLRQAVRYAIRFLDNVIDSTPYFFEENARVQGMERRVGLGTMGIAELMIKLGVRYGSEESLALIDRVYEMIAVESYKMSAEIAAEKGAFPAFEAEKFLQSGYMQEMPEDVREVIRKNGIRNVTLLTQAPTGCVAPDTLVSTADGMTPIIDLGDPNGMQWQIMTRDVHTDTGVRKASNFYINGVAPVKKITTQRGFSITATHNHRLRIVDEAGDYVWRRMDEMQTGDRVVLKRGTLSDGQPATLTPVEQGNRALSALPQTITADFAEMLGLYMGDGYTKKRGGMHIVVAQRDPDLLTHVKDLLCRIWGERHLGIEERVGCWTVNLTAYYIQRFFEANGMLKPAGNHGEGAAGAFIPAKVLHSGRDTVAAFLRGLFEADGSISRGTITLVSTSHTLIQQVQTALLGLGVVATVRTMPKQTKRYGDRPLYELRTLNRREAQRFVEQVGFISVRKRALAAELGAMSDRGDSIAVPALIQEFYAQSAGLPNTARQRIIGLVSNGALTQQFVRETVAEYPQLADSRLARLVDLDIYIDAVESIEDGVSPTYDISVPDNHTYIANGFVSHNTTGTMANTSTGVEPFFSWVYYRKSRLGLHEEQVPLVKEWREQNPDTEKLPDYFITAMELSPDEHVRVQAAFQRWVDSAISKTANVPNNYTVEQVSDLYKYMYELGCKGGTIYRDGSRDEQVLMLKGDERAENEMEKVKTRQDAPRASEKTSQPDTNAPASPHRVYPRPATLTGVTANCPTPFGTAYVTMNVDEHGYPFEVFITAPGKAGSDLQADAEGLGRMISLSLRTTEPHNRREMLKLIIEQLRDIGGSRAVGFGPNRVMSLPDSVARALEDHFFTGEQPQQLSLPMTNGGPYEDPKPVAQPISGTNGTHSETHGGVISGADMCPSCGTISLVRAEGCRKCLTCGYSEC